MSFLSPGPFCQRTGIGFYTTFIRVFCGKVPVELLEMSVSFGPNLSTIAHELLKSPVDFCLALRASA